MTTVRCDMSVSLDGFIGGPEAKEPPYPDDGFFRVTSWLYDLAAWRERQGMEGGVTTPDDGLHLHVSPVLLGDGTRLFEGLPPGICELDRLRVIDSPGPTHLSFRFPTASPAPPQAPAFPPQAPAFPPQEETSGEHHTRDRDLG
jgi:hypothetical protein